MTLSPSADEPAIRSWLKVLTPLLAVTTVACASLAGREPLISDRPDFTESASVIAPRHLQLEVGATLAETGPLHTSAADTRKFFNVGGTLLSSPDLQVDARAGIGPSWQSRDYFVGIGMVRRW